MERYDCIIVGTGPAGLGTAFALRAANKKASILIIDQAHVSSGGLRNDCKMNFTYPIGFPTEYWTPEQAHYYLEKTEAFLKPTILEKNNLSVYQKRASRIGVELLSIRQSHLGTDGGLKLIKTLIAQLIAQGVDVSLEETFYSIEKGEKIAHTSKRDVAFNHLVVAPGRHGFDFLRTFMADNDIAYLDNSIDVGVRVETRIERYPIVHDYYDPKFMFPESTRTFCTNSGAAAVVKEKYVAKDGRRYYSVNGHAYSNRQKNTGLVNFAMLRTVRFTEPIASGQDYAEFLASLAMLTGGGKPLLQRVGDFRLGQRSSKESLNDDLFDFKPSLSSCTPADISVAMPAKFLHSIWKSLKKLDSIVPGILHPSTILYYPEIKLYANKPVFLNDFFMVKKDIYVIGDGAGTSRGITGAWASGMRASDGICKNGF